MVSTASSNTVNFTQVCRDCKKYWKTFKIDIDKCYDKNGKSVVGTSELYENFSFICIKCGLLNILSFDQLCNPKTVLFLRKKKSSNI